MRLPPITLTILTALLLYACRGEQRLCPAAWLAAHPAFDSVMVRLEHRFNDFAPVDTLQQGVARLEGIARQCDHDSAVRTLLQERALYWRAKLFLRRGLNDSCVATARKALLLNDSSRHYYDRLRILSLISTTCDSIGGAFQYRHFMEAIRYARKLHDDLFMAYSVIGLGNLLHDIGEEEKALCYLKLGDSLCLALGYDRLAFKNRINEANILAAMDRLEESNSMLRSMLGHSYLNDNTSAETTVLCNLFLQTDSIHYVWKAYRIAQNNGYTDFTGLCEALLAQKKQLEGQLDSMLWYSDRSFHRLPHIRDFGHRSLILLMRSRTFELRGSSDSALFYRIEYEKNHEKATSLRDADNVLRLSAVRELNVAEAEYKAQLYKRNLMIVIILFFGLAASGATFYIYKHRRMHERLRRARAELELEKARKRLLASSVSIEEKDRMLTSLRNELSGMRREGKIDEGGAHRIESSIKVHMAEKESDESFRERFDAVNPGFGDLLKERCNGLADTYVNLACYLLMGVDCKKIAKITGVKPMSVYQARWRLKRKLGLADGESLEDYLSHLNDRASEIHLRKKL